VWRSGASAASKAAPATRSRVRTTLQRCATLPPTWTDPCLAPSKGTISACGPRCSAARSYPQLGQTPVSRHRKGPGVEKYVGELLRFDGRGKSCTSTVRRHDGMTSQICDAVVITEITLPVSALRKGGGPAGLNKTSQLLLPVAIPTPAQRLSNICAETDVLAADAIQGTGSPTVESGAIVVPGGLSKYPGG
jgi:hypothetical protein